MSENNEKVINKSVINWFPGHMAKTKREIKEKLDLIDIVSADIKLPSATGVNGTLEKHNTFFSTVRQNNF